MRGKVDRDRDWAEAFALVAGTLMEQREVSAYRIGLETGRDPDVVRRYALGHRLPPAPVVAEMARVLNIDVAALFAAVDRESERIHAERNASGG